MYMYMYMYVYVYVYVCVYVYVYFHIYIVYLIYVETNGTVSCQCQAAGATGASWCPTQSSAWELRFPQMAMHFLVFCWYLSNLFLFVYIYIHTRYVYTYYMYVDLMCRTVDILIYWCTLEIWVKKNAVDKADNRGGRASDTGELVVNSVWW